MPDAAQYIGSIASGAQGVGMSIIGIVAWLGAVLVFGGVAGLVTWMYASKKKFNNNIIVMEMINNNWQITRRDRAAEIKHGNDGNTIFFLKKHKKIMQTPQIQIGPRTFLFKIREDGEWINVPLYGGEEETLEEKQKYLIHRDLRLSRTALQKRKDQRYGNQPSWIAQNWTWIVGISFVIALGVSVFLLFDKWIELAQVTNAGVETAGRVLEKADHLISRMEVIEAGGKGYIKVQQ